MTDAEANELRAELARARKMARAWKIMAYYREQEAWANEGIPESDNYPEEARAHAYKRELRGINRRARLIPRPPMPWVEERRAYLVAWLEEHQQR